MPCAKIYMKTIKNRFFAFGCSYTLYKWPTWADIIGQSYNNNYYNYGMFGAGNIYIFNMLMQADQIHKITKNDLVIIQWSSILREDRYIDKKWITKGGLPNYYPAEYIKNYFDMRGFFIRDIAMIKAAKDLLEKIGCKFYFISMCGVGLSLNINLDDTQFELSKTSSDVIDLYKDVLETIQPSFYSVLGQVPKPFLLTNYVTLNDSHRVPSDHLVYIKQVLPEFAPLDDEFVKSADSQIREVYSAVGKVTFEDYPWRGINRGIRYKTL